MRTRGPSLGPWASLIQKHKFLVRWRPGLCALTCLMHSLASVFPGEDSLNILQSLEYRDAHSWVFCKWLLTWIGYALFSVPPQWMSIILENPPSCRTKEWPQIALGNYPQWMAVCMESKICLLCLSEPMAVGIMWCLCFESSAGLQTLLRVTEDCVSICLRNSSTFAFTIRILLWLRLKPMVLIKAEYLL